MQEELGYIEGGSQTLVNALCSAILQSGGRIHTRRAAQKVLVQDGRVTGVSTANGVVPADEVICTVPTPLISAMVPDLPADWKVRYDSILNTGVCCLVFKLKRSISPHFWVNISDPDIAIPGIVEFSRLRSVGDQSVVYVPYYMPADNVKFTWTDKQLLDEAFAFLQKLQPELTPEDVIAAHVARLRYAQPVCEPGFAAKIPSVQTPVKGLQIADTCFYYPEDRGISESVRFGREMAHRLPRLSRLHS
jgi:protoporphyrinogen oxidase